MKLNLSLLKTKNKISFYLLVFLILIGLAACAQRQNKEDHASKKPNIVIIYLDDLGYGDVGAYGATELETPNIDWLATNGRRLTDAHSASATCTPSRYALLTGIYPWREGASILPGTAALIIDTTRVTFPKMLKKVGYHTGVVGKWHLGLGNGDIDWNKKITPGPNEVGFDYSFIMAATQDRVPTVFIENGNVVGLDPEDPIKVSYQHNFEGEPTGKNNPELVTMMPSHGHNNSIVNGIPRIGFMKGGKSARWKDVEMAHTFLQKAQSYVKRHKKEPFFLYYAMHEPHVPRTPHPRFVGSSGMGSRGDVIVEADWAIGQFIKTLKEERVLKNTLIIFSSDNGPVVNDGYVDGSIKKLGDHQPAGPFRGGKYSLYEAGTRVPFITYWQGKIEPGVSNALISQIDLLASLGKLTSSELDFGKTDSKELLDVLMGKSENGRNQLIYEATSRTALRKGDWVMIPPYRGPAVNKWVNIELGNSENYQLYNVEKDPGQENNLAGEKPEKLKRMVAEYEKVRN